MGDALKAVDIDESFDRVWLGANHSCGRTRNGTLFCCQNNHGQLGIGTDLDIGDNAAELNVNAQPVLLPDAAVAKDLCLGDGHTCVHLADDTVRCWGRNDKGQLGSENGVSRGKAPETMGNALPPVNLGNDVSVRQITCGSRHTCALLNNGQLKCWGYNLLGQLGLGVETRTVGNRPDSMGDNLPPVQLAPGMTPQAVVAGDLHTCVLLESGRISCWGSNSDGGLGTGLGGIRGKSPNDMGENLPSLSLPGQERATQLALGYEMTCALSGTGHVYCWGRNGRTGAVGSGTATLSVEFTGPEHPSVVGRVKRIRYRRLRSACVCSFSGRNQPMLGSQ